MAQYRTVEGQITTVDTLTALTTFGGETAIGPVKVPAGASRLVEFWAAVGPHVDTAGDDVGVIMRLSGKGLRDGDQDFALAGVGGGVTNTGTTCNMAQKYAVDLAVVPNETINVSAAPVGDTVLLAEVLITLVFA